MKKLGGGPWIMHVLKEFGNGSAFNGLRRYGDERDAAGYRRGFKDGAAWMVQQLNRQKRLPKG